MLQTCHHQARHLLEDRDDLVWKGDRCIENYRDWGTAHNCCPYCGYRHQVWYLSWKRNIKQWRKNNQVGIFVRFNQDDELGYGQRDEFRYLTKHQCCFLDLTIGQFEDIISK